MDVLSLSDLKFTTLVISLVNLVLVSVMFSLSMIRFNNFWVAAGIHAGWNYMLSYVCGLELSGSEGMDGMLKFVVNPSMDWLHGGAYGIEAGIIVTVLLVICDVVLLNIKKDK